MTDTRTDRHRPPARQRPVDEVLVELAALLDRAESILGKLRGTVPVAADRILDLRPMVNEAAGPLAGTRELVRQALDAVDVLVRDVPLADRFPNGNLRQPVLTPRQVTYLAALASDAALAPRHMREGKRGQEP